MGGAGVRKRTTGAPGSRPSGANVPNVSYLLSSTLWRLTKPSKPRQRADTLPFTTQYAGSGACVFASSPRKNWLLTYVAPADTVAHGHGCQARPKLSRCLGISGIVFPAATNCAPPARGEASSALSWKVARV